MKGKEIFIWLFLFIVGSLIVSFLVSPGSFDSFVDNIQSVVPAFDSSGSGYSSDGLSNSDYSSCLSEIKERSRMAEEKSMLNLDVSVIEYKRFNNTHSALEYLYDWGIVTKVISGYNPYPEFLEPTIGRYYVQFDINKEEDRQHIIEHDNFIVFLVRFEYDNGMESYKQLVPIICIDSELTESSKSKFKIAF